MSKLIDRDVNGRQIQLDASRHANVDDVQFAKRRFSLLRGYPYHAIGTRALIANRIRPKVTHYHLRFAIDRLVGRQLRRQEC